MRDGMKVIVLSNEQLEELALTESKKEYGKSLAITIHSIGNSRAFILNTIKNGIVDVLELEFNDTEEDNVVAGGIKTSDIEKTVSIVEFYKGCVDTIFVACENGIYKSGGCALAIAEYLGIRVEDTKGITIGSGVINRLAYEKLKRAFDKIENSGQLDPETSGKAIYIDLADNILKGIQSGKIGLAGESLPDICVLSKALGVSVRNTSLAYRLLLDTGKVKYEAGEYKIINKLKSNGTAICSDHTYRKIENNLLNAVEIAKANGVTPTELITMLCDLY